MIRSSICVQIVNLEKFIVISCQWLCNHIIGPVMSPFYFPVHLKLVHDGIASKQEIGDALSDFGEENNAAFVPVDVGVSVLCQLEVCFELDGKKDTYQFPVHVQARERSELWTVKEEMNVYCGRRVQCQFEIDMISPGAFTVIQCRVSVVPKFLTVLWQGAVQVTERVPAGDKIVEGLIEAKDHRAFKAIDVVTRAPSGCESQCKDLLDRLLDIVKVVLRERSPGTAIETCYLSRRHISDLLENPHGYSDSEIMEARQLGPNAVVCAESKDGVLTESLAELMVGSEDAVSTGASRREEEVKDNIYEREEAHFSSMRQMNKMQHQFSRCKLHSLG